jgi:hypothetical protein
MPNLLENFTNNLYKFIRKIYIKLFINFTNYSQMISMLGPDAPVPSPTPTQPGRAGDREETDAARRGG